MARKCSRKQLAALAKGRAKLRAKCKGERTSQKTKAIYNPNLITPEIREANRKFKMASMQADMERFMHKKNPRANGL